MNSKILLIILSCFLISFCVPLTLKAAPDKSALSSQQALAQAQNYLYRADHSFPPQSYRYELLAAELYIKAGALHKAEPLLAALSYTPLPRPLMAFKSKLETEFVAKRTEKREQKRAQKELKERELKEQSLTSFNTSDQATPVTVINLKSNSIPHAPRHAAAHVALLLPLTGPHAPASEAIKNGFLANHNTNQLQIKIYDSTQTNDIRSLYHQAVQDGAQFVVGPLIKEDVYALSKLPQDELTVPVLALNSHPDIQNIEQKRFFQFALSPEEEAKSLANKAFRDGHRSTSVIVPDNDWGKRVLAAFSKQWQQLGGKIPSSVLIHSTQNQAAVVRKLLNVSEHYNPKKKYKQ